jgi:hypothetical protein
MGGASGDCGGALGVFCLEVVGAELGAGIEIGGVDAVESMVVSVPVAAGRPITAKRSGAEVPHDQQNASPMRSPAEHRSQVLDCVSVVKLLPHTPQKF